jgi:hypothetical protein
MAFSKQWKIVGGLAVICGCLVACSTTSASLAHANESRQTLELLSAGLKESSAPMRVVDGRRSFIGLQRLIGLPKIDIVASLGKPTYECKYDRDVAGCTRRGDMFYSFYKLSSDELGGGPELSLSFDDKGNCIRADWIVSQ